MTVLVIGATGFLGAALAARLLDRGHDVAGLARGGKPPPGVDPMHHADIASFVRAADWGPYLDGVTAVVNCAGVLQDGPEDSALGVHATGVAALFTACEERDIRRVIHISAIGVDRAQPSAFSATKLAGDNALMGRDLDWVILRPSVILGPGAQGSGGLIRGLSALPVLPVMPDTAPVQPVQLDDVLDTILHFLDPGAPSQLALDLAGPDPLPFETVVAIYRRWLGWPRARDWRVPPWLARLLWRAGDAAARLGWRPALRSAAAAEMTRGAMGDPRPWADHLGRAPRSVVGGLRGRPATVQDRWYAALYLQKAVVFTVLPLFWIATAAVSLTVGFRVGHDYLLAGGLGWLSGPAVVAGALADLLIGIGILWRPWARAALWAGIALSVFYTVAGTLVLPVLWIDPIGPMLKIWPVIVLHGLALAILPGR